MKRILYLLSSEAYADRYIYNNIIKQYGMRVIRVVAIEAVVVVVTVTGYTYIHDDGR